MKTLLLSIVLFLCQIGYAQSLKAVSPKCSEMASLLKIEKIIDNYNSAVYIITNTAKVDLAVYKVFNVNQNSLITEYLNHFKPGAQFKLGQKNGGGIPRTVRLVVMDDKYDWFKNGKTLCGAEAQDLQQQMVKEVCDLIGADSSCYKEQK